MPSMMRCRPNLKERDRLAALTEIIRSLQEEGTTAEDIVVRRPTLDEAFLHLTGQQPPSGDIASPSLQPAEVNTQ